MSDLVERLRAHGDQFPIKNSAEWIDFASLYLVEAAARIESLEKALEKMKRSRDRYRQAWEAEKARAALEGKP